MFRLAQVCEIRVKEDMGRHPAEHILLTGQIAEHRIAEYRGAVPDGARKRTALFGSRRRQIDQPLRFLHWKLPEKSLMDEGEDGGVGADSQPDREQGDEREGSIPQESAQRVFDVVG